jgi:hypothetical protein
MGESEFGFFWGYGRESTWGLRGGGAVSVSLCAFGGTLFEELLCKMGWAWVRIDEGFTVKEGP